MKETHKHIFLENLKKDITDGLKSIDYFRSDSVVTSEEDLYKELNRMENAPVEEDLVISPNGITKFSRFPELSEDQLDAMAKEVLPIAQQISK